MKATEFLCPCCRGKKTTSYFYNGLGIQNTKNLPICKDCCKAKLEKYSALLGDDGGAWVLMAELGVPFIRDTWKSSQNGAKVSTAKTGNNADVIAIYLKNLKEKGIAYQGFWDSDTMLDELRGKKKKQVKQDYDVDDMNAMRNKWGSYENYKEAYEFLEDMFNDYTADLLDMDANLTNRYKDLCIAEYAKRKAQEGGDIAEISKAQDNVTKQLKLLKLDDFQSNQQSDEEKRIEKLAWIIENVRPAECEDLEQYKDFSGFHKTWNEIRRCVMNLVGGSKQYPDIPKDVM